jgi:hypothetical protein
VSGPAVWRDDIDSLSFRPDGHAGPCVMHRLAFRTLLGRPPSPDECLDLFAERRAAFEAAAARKIARRRLAPSAAFHITSRDVERVS